MTTLKKSTKRLDCCSFKNCYLKAKRNSTMNSLRFSRQSRISAKGFKSASQCSSSILELTEKVRISSSRGTMTITKISQTRRRNYSKKYVSSFRSIRKWHKKEIRSTSTKMTNDESKLRIKHKYSYRGKLLQISISIHDLANISKNLHH